MADHCQKASPAFLSSVIAHFALESSFAINAEGKIHQMDNVFVLVAKNLFSSNERFPAVLTLNGLRRPVTVA